jgi:hypothetical protein
VTDRTLLDILAPIDPTTQVERIPAIDAVCEAGLNESACKWPFCPCRFPDRYPPEKEAA